MKKVGIIGWRGMVGSVLIERMLAEQDFSRIDAQFFSTSQVGGKGPNIGRDTPPLADANDIDALRRMDVLISCQGGDYTKEVHPKLRKAGWGGYFIDAASTLRMSKDAIIVLDPVNLDIIKRGIHARRARLHRRQLHRQLDADGDHRALPPRVGRVGQQPTYQAASGAGAKNMRELVSQMRVLGNACARLLDDPASSSLDIDRAVSSTLVSSEFPRKEFGAPLAAA